VEVERLRLEELKKQRDSSEFLPKPQDSPETLRRKQQQAKELQNQIASLIKK